MRILDRYIMKNFLVGYAIAFCVLIGLWVLIDLFVNLDEFTERSDQGIWAVTMRVASFYGLHVTVYFRDLAGVIAVAAAAFSLGKMVRDNELVAIIASGVSAQRIVRPILLMALVSTALWVADQELLIPSISAKLARHQGDIPGEEYFKVHFLSDGKGSLICSRAFYVKTATLDKPTIVTRRATDKVGIWEVTGRIDADRARFNETTGEWDLDNGRFIGMNSQAGPQAITSYLAPGSPAEGYPGLLRVGVQVPVQFASVVRAGRSEGTVAGGGRDL